MFHKLADWTAYAEAEFVPITESGGKITGYYPPTEFAGATSDARVLATKSGPIVIRVLLVHPEKGLTGRTRL